MTFVTMRIMLIVIVEHDNDGDEGVGDGMTTMGMMVTMWSMRMVM